jgi:hypothetical protein
VYIVLARGTGMVMGMTIEKADAPALAELLPPLERIGRTLSAELAAKGRDGYAEIPWYVHEHCSAWLPPRPRAEDAEVTRALQGLRDALARAPHARLGEPASEAERHAVECTWESMLPAPVEVLYAEASGLSVTDDAARVHTPLLPIADVEPDRQYGVVLGTWGDGTRVFFGPKGVLVRPMIPGKKKPKKGKVRRLADDLPSYLEALATARGELPTLIG